MSRSNPTANNPNPSTRWFEWKGAEGKLCWFDKEAKKSVEVKDGFTFLALDQLSTVTGYNKKAKSGVHSNEVRDARSDVLVVKYFSGDVIAEGTWGNIKERVSFNGGKFAASVYIAFKGEKGLQIGNIRMSGCALGPWFDFVKKNRKVVDTEAVSIRAGEEDTSGSVDFVPPIFSIKEVSAETQEEATALDRELQEFLASYLKRPISDKLDQRPAHQADEDDQRRPDEEDAPPARNQRRAVEPEEPADDDIPF